MKKTLIFLIAIVVMSICSIALAYDPAAGKATYDASCSMCHRTGMMGAPKVGDKAAWAPHIAKGMDTMIANAIKG